MEAKKDVRKIMERLKTEIESDYIDARMKIMGLTQELENES